MINFVAFFPGNTLSWCGLYGRVSEWLKEHAWKACVRENVPWVRIPPLPPFFPLWISQMANQLKQIRSILQSYADNSTCAPAIFFKTGPGQYSEHDKFIGVSVPNLRKIGKEFRDLPMDQIQSLLESPVNEERFLALILLVENYAKGNEAQKEIVFQHYLNNLKHVNNWNLVDASAHLIVGAHLSKKDKSLLLKLAKSQVMWERRVAIVSTWYFIRQNEHEWTVQIAELLLKDSHDLIHKAVGWMLREAGKKDQQVLIKFLEKHSKQMPRTMLRYAIEKFSEEERRNYLK